MDDSDEIYTVERILSHRISKNSGELQYLVKWLNYDLETSTWEPEENLFCRRLIEQYWTNPQPNRSLKNIVQVEMAKRAFNGELQDKERNRSDEPDSGEVTSDDSDEGILYADEEKFVHCRIPPNKTQEAFDTRAFVKLGLVVSAIIVILFILWTGGDEYYMSEFYRRAFEQKHQRHSSSSGRHQEH